MTENEIRQLVVRQAEYWLGRKESDGSHRVIIDIYNGIAPLPRGYKMRYTDPWCASFVSAVGKALGLTDIIFPECACDPMIALYKAAGRWEEDDDHIPRPGDVIFYDWQDDGIGDCRGSSDHVGIVTAVSGDTLTIIEGNCSDSVCRLHRTVGGRYIRGYGLPDYPSKADGEPLKEDPGIPGDPGVVVVGRDEETDCHVADAPRNDGECELLVPMLRHGDVGDAVMAAQQLMRLRGFRCGAGGADGDFGPATLGAVYRFQRAYGLEVDGIIGPKTWKALIYGGDKP